MQFRRTHFHSALIAVSVAVLAPVAHADQKIVATTTVDGPQLRVMMTQMSPDQRAAMSKYGMGGPINSTAYVSGKKIRTDTNGSSVLLDSVAKTLTTLSRESHTYTTRPYDPAKAQAASAGTSATITPAGDSKKLLGHVARHYKLTITTTSGPMAGTPIHGEVWAAPDLPQPPSLPMPGPAGVLQSQLKKIKGFPLLTVIAIPNSPTGPITVKTVINSVSSATLPASTFAIPAGYKKSAPGAGVGMPGMPGM
ncbi:hypothetical protein CCAX7_53180 [Capsulimonas corticalis]|uniref:Uncharacterized protein n=1 Tax=Capsulimonas corticalis TaxID=2219043 RepID=A0A402CNQ1_9BACT|nr:DUF4412 domain-containing protein [Capsulimonas corticalis]BDI33267.1 hypothetical protein CCAX7_53180 [Capsulimonas corticalis]